MFKLGFCMDYKNVAVMNISLTFYMECVTMRATVCVFTPAHT